MNRLPNAWRPMLLGALLMLVLVGVAGAVPTDQPNALSTRRQIMLSAADFYPCDSDYAYENNGDYFHTTSGAGKFMASVDFPYPLWVTLDKFELFARDNNSAEQISATFYISKPTSTMSVVMGSVLTGDAYASPTWGTWQYTPPIAEVKNPADDVYVTVYISDPAELAVTGVRIFYYMGR